MIPPCRGAEFRSDEASRALMEKGEHDVHDRLHSERTRGQSHDEKCDVADPGGRRRKISILAWAIQNLAITLCDGQPRDIDRQQGGMQNKHRSNIGKISVGQKQDVAENSDQPQRHHRAHQKRGEHRRRGRVTDDLRYLPLPIREPCNSGELRSIVDAAEAVSLPAGA